jgi:hypothetical protein
MTQQKTRKQRVMFSVEQKLDYVKLMINEGYTNRQIIESCCQMEEAIPSRA